MAPDLTRVAMVVVLVCAFGLVAATVDTGTVPEGDGDGGTTNFDLDLDLFDLPNERSDGSLCPAFLDDPAGLGFTIVLVGIGMVAGYRHLGSPAPVIVVGVPIALWSIGCSALVGPIFGLSWLHGRAPSPTLSLAAIALCLLGMLGFLWVTSDEEVGTVGARHVESSRPVDLDAIATAAGAAAARIDAQADVENEVYRAWLEMTDHLGVVRPETLTPDEFEGLAVEAGMRPTDVSELTRLFRDVRYGDRPLTGREDRAVAALERIEREYGGHHE